MCVTTHLTCAFRCIKYSDSDADTEDMNNLKLRESQPSHTTFGAGVPRVHHAIEDVSVDVVQAAILVAENTPDPRADRVERALVRLDAGRLDASHVAQAMIASILADSRR
jgi:putative ribosome biogenesis GTPase RsgA